MTYSPSLALATAAFEILAAVWILRGPGRRDVLLASGLILLLLAGYQLTEVAICSRGSGAAPLPQIAFMVVSWLPPLGWLLIARVSPTSRTLSILSYAALATALAVVVWIAVDARFVSDSVCNVVYAKYVTPLPRFLFYAWFYWIGLAGMLAGSAVGLRRSASNLERAQLLCLLLGSLGFIAPAVIVTHFVAPAEGALPSVMCHFAVVLAVAIVRMIVLERQAARVPANALAI